MGYYLYCHLCDLHHKLDESEPLKALWFIWKHIDTCRDSGIRIVHRHYFDNDYFWSYVTIDDDIEPEKYNKDTILKRLKKMVESDRRYTPDYVLPNFGCSLELQCDGKSLYETRQRVLYVEPPIDFDKKRESIIECKVCTTKHDYQGCPHCGWDPDDGSMRLGYIKNKEKIEKMTHTWGKLEKLTREFEEKKIPHKEVCEKLVEEGFIIS